MSPLDHGSRSLGVVDGAEADLADDPDAFLGEVFEVLLDQTLLEDQSAAFDLHAGNAGDHRHIVGNQFGTCRRHRAGRDPPLTVTDFMN